MCFNTLKFDFTKSSIFDIMNRDELIREFQKILDLLKQILDAEEIIEELKQELVKNFWKATHTYFPSTLEVCEPNHKIIDNALNYYGYRVAKGVIPIALNKDNEELEKRKEEFKDKRALYQLEEDEKPPFKMERFEKVFGNNLEDIKQGIPEAAFQRLYLEWIEEEQEIYERKLTKQNYELAIRSAIYEALNTVYFDFISTATSLQIRYCDWYVCYIAGEITFDISDMSLYRDDQTADFKNHYARFDWDK